MILSERRLSIVTERAASTTDRSEVVPADSKRRVWLVVVAVFGLIGVMSGSAALVISLLTACAVLRDGKGSSILVSALLIGCLGALLLAAHGMDRFAALRWDEKSTGPDTFENL
jgi:hypothetical protein